MSLLKGKDTYFNESNDIEYLYYNINRRVIADSKENVIINKIDKEKLKAELINLNVNDIEKVFKQYLNAFKKDYKYLKKYNNNNIFKCIDFIDKEKEIVIIKEDADMNFYKYIKSRSKGLEIDEIKYIFNQINNNIIKILRNNSKIHTCICSHNLYLKYNNINNSNGKNYIIKLFDFGCVYKLEIQLKIQLNIKNKLDYIAPELFKFNNKTEINQIDKADLWSLGVLLFFLRYNKLPEKDGLTSRDIIINEDENDSLLIDILNKLLIVDPNERLSWEDYFNHEFFKDNKKEKEISKSKEKHIDIKNGDKDKKENVTLKFNNGDKYIGEYLNNKKEGYGILFYNNGNKYKGEFKNDLKNGHGIFNYKNGEKYDGEYKNDLKDGRGIYYYINEEKFIGEYKEDKKNGHGIYFYKDGTKFIGEYKNDEKEGKGYYFDKEGDKIKEVIYEKGIEKEETIEVSRKENKEKEFIRDEKYEGEYINGLKEGSGIYNYSNGDKYIGIFVKNEKNGFGIYYYNNGDKYEGLFSHNEKNGKGIYYYFDGEKYI